MSTVVAVNAQAPSSAAATPASSLTIDQAVQYAADHYPTVRAALEQVNASMAGIDVAHSAYLPRLDSLWQSNRATANNVFGQLLPQSVIPSISGPALASSTASVWGSAAGALFSWEPFDFGLRHATVTTAEAGLTRARAGEALTRLDVQGAVADAYLIAVAAQRTVAAAQADLDRREVLRRAVQTLVDNQLRPGAEASRADAERAAAQVRLAQVQQRAAVADATLVRVLGMTTGTVAIAAEPLVTQVPAADIPGAAAAMHPLLQVRQATVEQSKAAEEVLARTDYPRVYVQSSLFGRGSGADPNGTFDGGLDGLGLERTNWAAGVQVVFPNVFDFSSRRARKTAAAAATRADIALLDEAALEVSSQQRTAAALLTSARTIAASTPVELAAARQAAAQARARYDAGLASITDVADAQGLLAAAEVQDELARVDVWRALLAVATAQGDLAPFLDLVRQP